MLCLVSEKVLTENLGKKKRSNCYKTFLQRHEERVIIISSKDSENSVSDAENALQNIASLILKVMLYHSNLDRCNYLIDIF